MSAAAPIPSGSCGVVFCTEPNCTVKPHCAHCYSSFHISKMCARAPKTCAVALCHCLDPSHTEHCSICRTVGNHFEEACPHKDVPRPATNRPTIKYAAGAIVACRLDGEEYLLVQQRSAHFPSTNKQLILTFPGGTMGYSGRPNAQDFLRCAVVELLEEAGLDLSAALPMLSDAHTTNGSFVWVIDAVSRLPRLRGPGPEHAWETDRFCYGDAIQHAYVPADRNATHVWVNLRDMPALLKYFFRYSKEQFEVAERFLGALRRQLGPSLVKEVVPFDL